MLFTSSCPFWPSFFFLQQLYKSCPSTSSGKSFSVTAGGPTDRLMSTLFVILWFQSAGPGQVKMNCFFFPPYFSWLKEPHKSAEENVVLSALQHALYMRRALSGWALSAMLYSVGKDQKQYFFLNQDKQNVKTYARKTVPKSFYMELTYCTSFCIIY